MTDAEPQVFSTTVHEFHLADSRVIRRTERRAVVQRKATDTMPETELECPVGVDQFGIDYAILLDPETLELDLVVIEPEGN